MKLNLCCGEDYRDGWTNTDRARTVKADHYFDIKDVFPFDDKTFDEIYCSGALEQIISNEDFVKVMNECWRVLIDGGVISIVVPDSNTPMAYRDPFDQRHFSPKTFDYLDKDCIEYKRYGVNYGFKPWKVVTCSSDRSPGILDVILRKCE